MSITPPPAVTPRNPSGAAALVLGVVAVLLFWLPCVDIILSGLAVTFGALGLSRAKKVGGSGATALAGLITGIIATLASLVVLAFFAFRPADAGNLVEAILGDVL